MSPSSGCVWDDAAISVQATFSGLTMTFCCDIRNNECWHAINQTKIDENYSQPGREIPLVCHVRFGWRERYESRGSRTVLREAGVKFPGLLTFQNKIFNVRIK